LLKLVGEKRSFRVLTAADGKAAIEVYKNHADEIDLVLLDWGLPGVGGGAVFRKLKELKPQVKVIGTTGYIEPDVRDRMLKEGVLEFLQKPLAPSEIFERVWFFCHPSDRHEI
jgi:CheY-like chemotaxis protein